ncbi:hypothetical protein TNCV_4912801 [Trichonephila clavipes]|nr:hypothetical protein TNCV_4912801 [Trichonephila clavipes]
MGDDVMDIHASQSDESLMDDLSPRPPQGGSPSFDSPLIVTPHRTLNSCRGVISESDLLYASETEILKVFLTRVSLSPKLPSNIKAGYLNCKYVHIYRILCAALSARGSVILKIPAADNSHVLGVQL